MGKFWLGVLFGAVGIIVVVSVVIGIASAVNDISYAEQITQWFGATPVIGEVVDEVTDEVVDEVVEQIAA